MLVEARDWSHGVPVQFSLEKAKQQICPRASGRTQSCRRLDFSSRPLQTCKRINSHGWKSRALWASVRAAGGLRLPIHAWVQVWWPVSRGKVFSVRHCSLACAPRTHAARESSIVEWGWRGPLSQLLRLAPWEDTTGRLEGGCGRP